ncbi:MAG: ketoacyl-ACP synthase III [Methylococcales bacterium]|nr:ketoacyl-ACP synthase III [Methylococcales bacterium]
MYGKITGWGCYLPEKVVTNQDLEKYLDTSDEWIVRRSGIRERRVAADHETTATMAVAASRNALASAELTPTDLDLIIVGTSTPDHLAPAVSSVIQHQLEATDCPAFTVMTGCTGFVYALNTAQQFIQGGVYKRILVIGVELLSRFVDWNDRATAVLFGDGAGACIMEATEEPCGVRGFDMGSDGSGAEFIIAPAGGSAEPATAKTVAEGRHTLRMNGREVFKFATRVLGRTANKSLAQAGIEMDDIDRIVPHQANMRIIQSAARIMKVPLHRFQITIDKYANTSAASIPLAICDGLATGQIKSDDTLLLVSFGAGLTWASCVLEMQPKKVVVNLNGKAKVDVAVPA